MRPELELLILCASPLRTAEVFARIGSLLDHPLDWTLLLDAADSHRLIPLLYRTLEDLRPSIIPPQLAADFRASARKSLLLTAELTRLLDLLASNGVTALPFKGPSLAIVAFDDVALRTFDDLDLLLRRADVWRARDVLLNSGYAAEVEIEAHHEEALLASYDEFVMRGKGGSPLVELHWSFLPRHFSVPLVPAKFFERSSTVSLGNRTIPSLRTEDLFLVLCLHAAKHCWSRLGFVCDLAWLMSRHELDWDAILAEARKLRVVRILLLAITLSERLFRTPVPGVMAKPCARDPRVSRLADRAIQAMFGKPHVETAILSTAMLHTQMREDPRDKLLYCFRLATRPGIEDWQAANLPPRVSFLYPVLRLPRLIRKYWR
jgi:hypothetical protein